MAHAAFEAVMAETIAAASAHVLPAVVGAELDAEEPEEAVEGQGEREEREEREGRASSQLYHSALRLLRMLAASPHAALLAASFCRPLIFHAGMRCKLLALSAKAEAETGRVATEDASGQATGGGVSAFADLAALSALMGRIARVERAYCQLLIDCMWGAADPPGAALGGGGGADGGGGVTLGVLRRLLLRVKATVSRCALWPLSSEIMPPAPPRLSSSSFSFSSSSSIQGGGGRQASAESGQQGQFIQFGQLGQTDQQVEAVAPAALATSSAASASARAALRAALVRDFLQRERFDGPSTSLRRVLSGLFSHPPPGLMLVLQGIWVQAVECWVKGQWAAVGDQEQLPQQGVEEGGAVLGMGRCRGRGQGQGVRKLLQRLLCMLDKARSVSRLELGPSLDCPFPRGAGGVIGGGGVGAAGGVFEVSAEVAFARCFRQGGEIDGDTAEGGAGGDGRPGCKGASSNPLAACPPPLMSALSLALARRLSWLLSLPLIRSPDAMTAAARWEEGERVTDLLQVIYPLPSI